MLTEEMINELQKYKKYWWKEDEETEYKEIKKEPFHLLIFTVLSQNTSSQNTRKAYIGLKKKFQISPHELMEADEKVLSEAIKAGGLHKIKARRIIDISKYIVENWNGKLDWLFKKSKEEARKELLKLPGIGNKTADVIISSIHGYKEAFVVDTHMRRIAIRMGLVDENAEYEEIQKKLSNIFPWKKIKGREEEILGLFWLLAKYTCNAIKPRCKECVLASICNRANNKR